MLRMFYFSGTGNARNVARWMAAAWAERGSQVAVTDLAGCGAGDVHVDSGDVVGIASPTHGFNFPPITLGFLFRFPRAPNANRVFIINTRAGVRFFGDRLSADVALGVPVGLGETFAFPVINFVYNF